MTLPKRIVVPTDFTPASSDALAMAIRLARASDGSITLLHAYEPPVYAVGAEVITNRDVSDRVDAAAKAALAETVASHANCGVPMKWLVRAGSPEEEILVAAEELDADLVVMATHGPRSARNTLGSVAENIVRHGRRPTLVVHERGTS